MWGSALLALFTTLTLLSCVSKNYVAIDPPCRAIAQNAAGETVVVTYTDRQCLIGSGDAKKERIVIRRHILEPEVEVEPTPRGIDSI